MSRQQRALRHAFVVTVSLGAMAACNTVTTVAECPSSTPPLAGHCGAIGDTCTYPDDPCGGSLIATCSKNGWAIESSAGPCNPPPVDPPTPTGCPIDSPQNGSACDTIDQFCSYSYYDGFCDERHVDATCTASGWFVEEWYGGGECNPPPAECPIDIPVDGAVCDYQPDTFDGWPTNCWYDTQTPCGSALIEASCAPYGEDEMRWDLALDVTCSATPEQCQTYDAAFGCGVDDGCQWLVPGCTDIGNNVATGCYPVGDCTSDGCGDWGTCSTVSHDPCQDADCKVCSAETAVCVP